MQTKASVLKIKIIYVVVFFVVTLILGNLLSYIELEDHLDDHTLTYKMFIKLQNQVQKQKVFNLLSNYQDNDNLQQPNLSMFSEQAVTTAQFNPDVLYIDYRTSSEKITQSNSEVKLEQEVKSIENTKKPNASTQFSIKESVYVKDYIKHCYADDNYALIKTHPYRFNFNFYGDYVAAQKQFIEKGIHENLRRIFSFFDFMGVKLKYVTDLEIHFYFNRSDFEQALRAHNLTVKKNPYTRTVGVYSHYHHKSFVFMDHDDNETLNTAVHEAIHAIIRVNFGKLPLAMNEGLATQLSPIRRNRNRSTVVNAINWHDKALLDKKPYDFYELFSKDYQQFYAKDSKHNYASSWVWMSYLLLNTTTRPIIVKALNQKILNPCYALDINQITLDLLYVQPYLKSDFEQWIYQRTRR